MSDIKVVGVNKVVQARSGGGLDTSAILNRRQDACLEYLSLGRVTV